MKKPSKKKSRHSRKGADALSNQLGAYCVAATAACGLVNGQKADAGIIKFFSGDTVSIGNPVLIDFDGAPVFSIAAVATESSSGFSLRIGDLNPQPSDSDGWLETTSLPGQASTGPINPNALPAGISVSIGQNFNTTGTFGRLRGVTSGNSYEGNFTTGIGERLIAVKFKKGTSLHFGWIGIAQPTASSAIVTGWAYEDVPSMGIITEVFGTVPEPHVSLLGLLALGAVGMGEYRRRRQSRLARQKEDA